MNVLTIKLPTNSQPRTMETNKNSDRDVAKDTILKEKGPDNAVNICLQAPQAQASPRQKRSFSASKTGNNAKTGAVYELSSSASGAKSKKSSWERAKLVQIWYLNVQIAAKVVEGESFADFIRRVVYITGADDDKEVALIPVSKITPVCPESPEKHSLEEEKMPAANAPDSNRRQVSASAGTFAQKYTDASVDEGGTPNSFEKKDLVTTHAAVEEDQIYYLVYTRHRTQDEQARYQREIDSVLSNTQLATTPKDAPASCRRASQRKKLVSYFQSKGINVHESFERPQRPRGGSKRSLFCPFVECLRDFQETGNLKTHLRIHTGERPFVCTFVDCGKRFITKGHLKTHELIHSGDKPFECDICGKTYSRTGRLKIHKRTHAGEKPFKCDFPGCEKRFTEKGNLKTHQRIHNGEKPFMCTFEGCNRSFTTHGHLSDHFRRHTGERPFQCGSCEQSFMRSSTLKIHMRRHTGEKPFECDVCSKRFAESGNLRTHKKIHLSVLPNSQVSDKTFSSAAHLVTKRQSSLQSSKQQNALSRHQLKSQNQNFSAFKVDSNDIPTKKRPASKSLTRLFHEATENEVQEAKKTRKRQKLAERDSSEQLELTNKEQVDQESYFCSNNKLEAQQLQQAFVAPQTAPAAAQNLPLYKQNCLPSMRTSQPQQSQLQQRTSLPHHQSLNPGPPTSMHAASNASQSVSRSLESHVPQQPNQFQNANKLLQNAIAQLAETSKNQQIERSGSIKVPVSDNNESNRAQFVKKHSFEKDVKPDSDSVVKEAVKSCTLETNEKKASTVEYPKEDSPQRMQNERPTSYFITPSMAYELAKASQGDSDKILVEHNNHEPNTPMSTIFMQRQFSNPHVINALNALSQIANQKSISNKMAENKNNSHLSSLPAQMSKVTSQQLPLGCLQKGTSVPYGNLTSSFLQNQNSLVKQNSTVSAGTVQDLMTKLVPMASYADAQGQYQTTAAMPPYEVTPQSALQLHILNQMNRNQSQLNLILSEGRQIEDHQSDLFLDQKQQHQQEQALRGPNAAILTDNSETKKTEDVNESKLLKTGGRQAEDDVSKLSFMNKNMSLNSNFQIKTPQEGTLTRVLNNLQNHCHQPSNASLAGSTPSQPNKLNQSTSSLNFPKSPNDVQTNQSPAKPGAAQIAVASQTVKATMPQTQSNNESEQRQVAQQLNGLANQGMSSLPSAIQKSTRAPSSFGSVSMAMAKLMQHHASKGALQSHSQMMQQAQAPSRQPQQLSSSSSSMPTQQQLNSMAQQSAQASSSVSGPKATLNNLQDSCSKIQEGAANNVSAFPPVCAEAKNAPNVGDTKSPTIVPTPLNHNAGTSGKPSHGMFMTKLVGSSVIKPNEAQVLGSSIMKPNESSFDQSAYYFGNSALRISASDNAHFQNALQQSHQPQNNLFGMRSGSFDLPHQAKKPNFFAVSPMVLNESQRLNLEAGMLDQTGQLLIGNQFGPSVSNHIGGVNMNMMSQQRKTSFWVTPMHSNSNSRDREKELEVESQNNFAPSGSEALFAGANYASQISPMPHLAHQRQHVPQTGNQSMVFQTSMPSQGMNCFSIQRAYEPNTPAEYKTPQGRIEKKK